MTFSKINPYHDKLTKRILSHRYRYYVLNHPVISDHEYDYLERFYNDYCNDNDLINYLEDTVGWSASHYKAKEIAFEVDNDLDDYSLWLKEMKPVWTKLGRSKHQQDPK